ncbi:norsolorinic acid reductase [Dacryopinax primogenitus]|uniref:Norsolorinic acid reductase n=1 Tax=Dacryopinax primogenitus (strain DJM 731) TaxID=1858805 RepID=M5FNE7_DACPD|nr:norsolorinic acid reductase [Dacryopinax primogenitus]EJT97315.1 norsolorinic acid reductase [Dacryopinax primogenitus]
MSRLPPNNVPSLTSVGPPRTKLGEYRLLSPSCGLRVSPLCLGGMSLGSAWEEVLGGGIPKDKAFELLDIYWKSGGNFIDTANDYQEEQSEQWIGQWMESRNNRDEIVLATKYSVGYRKARSDAEVYVNFTGNHKKSLHVSLRDSLAKLRTEYVDILYVHWWDYGSSVPEVMRALDDVVRSGKVLYLGISDTPAWVVSKANEYARAHGLNQFVVYQGEWSCLKRDFERDILPMCHAEGMGIAPWGVIAGGRFRTQAQLTQRLKEDNLRFGNKQLTEGEQKMSAALEKVANEVGGEASLVNVAISYCLHKQAYVFPIIGGKKVEHLKENIKALDIKLTPEQIEFLDAAVPFDIGFPMNLMGGDPALYKDGKSRVLLMPMCGSVQWVRADQPIDA